MTVSRSELFDKELIVQRLRDAWSAESSSLYTEDNPACGQCPVTALVIQDRFGGEIRKTPTEDGPHFYNSIGGQCYDLTAEQFDDPPSYLDLPSDREEAFAHANAEQYAALAKRFRTVSPEE